jgi:hypothetical protein
MLQKRTSEAAAAQDSQDNSWGSILMGGNSGGGNSRRMGYGETFSKAIVRSVASSVGRAIAGALFGRR